MKGFKKYYIVSFLLLVRFFLGAQSIGGTTSGAASYCGSGGASGFVSVSGYTGTIQYWEASVNGGNTWTNTGTTTPNQSYVNLSQSTCYRVIVKNGAFPPDTSTEVCITIYAPTVPGAVNGGGVFCTGTANGTLTLTGHTGNVLKWQSSVNGGNTWSSINVSTPTLNYTNVLQNTLYRAFVQNSAFCLVDTSLPATVLIDPVNVGGSVSGSDSACFGLNGDTLKLSGNTGDVIYWISSANNGASWIPLQNNSSSLVYAGLLQSTWYSAVIQSGVCPPDTSLSAFIYIHQQSPVFAGNDTTLMEGQSVQLNGSGHGSPFWLPVTGLSNPAVYNPVASPAVTTNYVLSVTDSNACLNADTLVLRVIPPVFNGTVNTYLSPDGDGINDCWYIEDIQLFPDNEVLVYNTAGQQVFTKRAYTNDWKGTFNGNALPDGTYFYVLRFDKTGKVIKGSLDILHGK